MGSAKKERAAAEAANRAAQAQVAQAVSELEAVGVPSVEAQKIAISKYMPEVVGQLDAQELEGTALSDIGVDPRLKEAQTAALNELQTRGETGLTVEDKQKFEELSRDVESAEQARQKAILASMAEQGNLGSGQELAARLASSQAATDRLSQEGSRLGAEAALGRRQALSQAGQMAGQIRNQDFGEQSRIAQAKDIAAQFNAQQRASTQAQNLQNQQRISDTRSDIQRQQEQYNKALIGQQYDQRMQKAGAISSARTGAAQVQQQQANAQANAAAMKTSANYQLAGSLIGAGAKAYASDINAKENIEPVKTKDLNELLDNVTGYNYDYKEPEKHGDGKQTGIMAQDLEKSKLGKQFVQEDQEGTKRIDYGQMAGTLLASQAELNERLKALEGSSGRKPASEPSMTGEQYSPDIPMGKEYKDGGYNNGDISESEEYEDGMRYDEAIEEGELENNMSAQEELLEVLRGLKSPESMEKGRIIEGESFTGDELPDRINSGESVNTVKMQDRNKKMLEDQANEIKGFRRLMIMLGEKL